MRLTKLDLSIIIFTTTALAALAIGYILSPTLVYDKGIWRYYWGPVVADALNHSVEYHGVLAHEGYTLVSEITYGIIVAISIYYIYRLIRRMKIQADWRFCVALLPYILFGSVSRTLEDTGFFKIPLTYWFISPLIYLQIGFYAILSIIIGWYIERKILNKKKKLFLIGLFFVVTILIVIWMQIQNLTSFYVSPAISVIIITFSFVPVLWDFIKIKNVRMNNFVLSTGLIPLLLSLIPISMWIMGFRWGKTTGVRIDVFSVIVVIVSIVTAVVYIVSRYKSNLRPFGVQLNLAMIFGHLIDGMTSYVSIYDPFHMNIPIYGEKHPISLFIMDISGGILFPVTKFILILLIIYIFDILYRDELKHHTTLVNLIKIGIFILGFAPGTRDLLRVTLGV